MQFTLGQNATLKMQLGSHRRVFCRRIQISELAKDVLSNPTNPRCDSEILQQAVFVIGKIYLSLLLGVILARFLAHISQGKVLL
jgi:hypothetical protein